jgi:hypothetical protein
MISAYGGGAVSLMDKMQHVIGDFTEISLLWRFQEGCVLMQFSMDDSTF